MDVKPLVSVEEWPVRPVQYTLMDGSVHKGLEVCRSSRHGISYCHIVCATGESITVPAENVQSIQNVTRIRLSVTVLEK